MKRRLPVVVENASSIRLDGSRATVHPADVHGRFTTARRVVFATLMAIYLGVPWIQVHGHPAVLFDLPARKFYLLGQVFNAQDTWLIFFLITGAGFALVAVTALLGRAWCGWACPQTVFLEGIFRPLQRLIEGSREKQLKREARGWTSDLVIRKIVLVTAYGAASAAVAHAFLSYFLPARTLWSAIAAGPGAHPEAFAWTLAWTALILFDFGYFREQFCVALCPYGRLQSALLDPDSLVVGYDTARGEPRGKAKAEGVGDCVDCQRCVVVCPTGIDIRNGLQMDCIACAQCIDACDEVMDKLHRPRGLVRYDSQQGLAGHARRVLRPRLAVYAVLGVLGLIAATVGLRSHENFEANVLRLPGPPYTLEDSTVRDGFEIHVINKRNAAVRYRVQPVALPGVSFVIPIAEVTLAPLASARLPVFATMAVADFHGDLTLHIRVVSDGDSRVVTAPFLGPGR